MILIVDLCYKRNSLSRHEFVNPIARIASKEHDIEIVHRSMLSKPLIDGSEKVILCGTAMKDNGYLENIRDLDIVKSSGVPTMGICAGMQALSMLYGGGVYPWRSIGLKDIEIIHDGPLLGRKRDIQGYHLHNYGISVPSDFIPLSVEDEHVTAFSSRDYKVFGILFHPEVRNGWIVERFLEL